MRPTLNTLVLLLLAVSLLTLSACGAGGFKIPGAPQPTPVELTVGSVCSECAPQTHSALNPFTEPVKYNTFGMQSVDEFVAKSNKTYGAVMVSEKLIDIATNMAANPNDANIKALGFTQPTQVLDLAKSMLETASQDIPGLLTSGQSMVTNLPSELASDPMKALAADSILTEVQTSIERLNEAQGKLTGLMGKIAG